MGTFYIITWFEAQEGETFLQHKKILSCFQKCDTMLNFSGTGEFSQVKIQANKI